MKKPAYLLILLFVLTSIRPTYANHMVGGEITWRCLSSGKYQFYMELYRKCTGPSFNFVAQTINTLGGAPVQSIIVKPDINRFALLNNGNISPIGSGGYQFKCSFPDPSPEAYQVFLFISDPITLSGVPSTNGWTFYWSDCCLPTYDNISASTSNLVHIKAIMYAYNLQNTNPCYDSSPRFIYRPTTSIQLGTKYSMSQNAIDNELDSLVFEFDDISTSANSLATWKSGYSKSSPFPGSNQNPNNIDVSIDKNSGFINGLIHTPDSFNTYAYSVRVDEYRNKTKISSIWRNMNIHTVPRDTLNTGLLNDLPYFTFDSIATDTYTITANVGDMVSVDIQVIDSNMVYDNPNDTSTLRPQNIKLNAKSMMFSLDFDDPNFCMMSNVTPCAILNPPPVPNSNGQIDLSANQSISTTFNWQTSCNNLTNNQNTYSFVFTALDENNPPRESFAVLKVRLKQKDSLFSVTGNHLSITESSSNYSWYFNGIYIPNSDTSTIVMHSNGVYKVQLNNGCRYSYTHTVVALKENSILQNISIFPNPSKDQFHISLRNLEHQEVEIKLRDMSGKQMQINSISNQNRIELDASHLSSGIYFLNISSNGEQANFKLVKL